MFRKILLAVFISCALVIGASSAKAENDKPCVGYDEGFFVRSDDGNFKLKFNVNMQMRYEFRAVEGGTNTNSFGFPRSRLILTGNAFDPKLTFMFMPEMGDYDQTHTAINTNQSANVYMRDLWINYAFSDKFQIKAGQFFLPRHRQASTISPQQQFGEYPITAFGDFSFTWDRGIDVHGSIEKLDYDTYLTNGNGGGLANNGKGMNIGTRIVYNLFGKYGYTESDINNSQDPNLAVGGHISYNNNDNYNNLTLATTNAGPNYLMVSGDAALKYKGFSFEGEFIDLYNDRDNANHPAFTLQAGYFIIPTHLEVAAQASRIFYNGADNDQSEYIGGLAYYFKGHKVKLHATYSLLVDGDGNGTAGNGFAGSANDQVDHRLRALLGFAF